MKYTLFLSLILLSACVTRGEYNTLQIEKAVTYNSRGEIEEIIEYTYNQKGLLTLKKVDSLWGITEVLYSYDDKNRIINRESQFEAIPGSARLSITYHPESQEAIHSITTEMIEKEITHSFDRGELVQIVITSTEDFSPVKIVKENKGNRVIYSHMNPAGILTKKISFTFQDNLITEMEKWDLSMVTEISLFQYDGITLKEKITKTDYTEKKTVYTVIPVKSVINTNYYSVEEYSLFYYFYNEESFKP